MNLRRTIAAAAGALLLVASLTACFSLPIPGGNTGGGSDTDLVGTTWSGVDSDGDSWGIEFQSDETIGLTYNDSAYDDASDTWSLDGSTLSIHVAFSDGDVDLVGDYDGGDVVDFDGSYAGGGFTLTLTRD
jgi:hypothetical protein